MGQFLELVIGRAAPGISSRARVTRVLVGALALYTSVVLSFIVFVVLVGDHDPTDRAIILMASGLVLLWIVLGGLLTLRYRERVRAFLLGRSLRWEWRFFLLATLLSLVEEAITTGMTNLAPEFGSHIGVAFITASNNYLIVIAFSSVVILVPEFAAWTYLLRKFDFLPTEVLLLYGLLGTLMESTLQPTALVAGFWFFVYGLMVYLPAYALPRDRGAVAPPWWAYGAAVLLPLACALPVAGVDSLLAHALKIRLWH